MSQLLTCTSSTRPSDVRTGDLLFETDTNRLIFWDGIVWRIYNSDRSLPGTGGDDELHYPAGIWSDSGASYFVNTAPLLHFDYNYVDGSTRTDLSSMNGTALDANASSSGVDWNSRIGAYVARSASSNANNLLSYNSSRKGFHARKFLDGTNTASNAHLSIGTASSDSSSININSKIFTHFLVISSTSSEVLGAIPCHHPSGSSSMISGDQPNHNKLAGMDPSSGAVHTRLPKDNGDPMIVVVRSDSGGASGWVLNPKTGGVPENGSRVVGATHASSDRSLPLEQIGYSNSGTYWNGVYSEIITYTTTLSKADTNTITQYLCNKYDIAFIELNI
ncbi:MAG: hypothetical protein CMM25_07905 [Rhodospirillaceae bacterium]|nr:hypothetical protein [Rhodospirillaceae bacterium]